MADEKIVIQISGNINADVAARIRAIATAATDAAQDIRAFKAELRSFGTAAGLKTITADATRFKTEITKATAETRKFTTAIKQADGMSVRFGKSAGNLSGQLSGLLGGFSAFFAAQQWSQASDAMISYENRLKVVGLEGERLDGVMGHLTETALRNGQSMDGLSALYMKVASAAADLGANQEDSLKFIDAVAAGLRIQGASAGAANGALIQLSQAIGSARVEAQEFNSIVEAAYPLAQAAARGIDGFGGSVAKLQAFIRSGGTITGEQLFRGVIEGLDELNGKVSQTQLTIGQALQNLRTRFEVWTKDTQGAASLVVMAIEAIGQNLNIIIPIIGLFAAAWAAVGLANIITSFYALTAAAVGFLVPLAPLVVLTAAWATVIGLVLAALLSVAYAIAVLTGNGDAFAKFIADAIINVKEMAGQLLGLGDDSSVATKALDAMGLTQNAVNSAVNGGTAALTAGTKAVNDNAKATTAWASTTTKAVNEVVNAYNQLSRAKQAALAVGAANHYNQLQAQGGSSGSFQTLASGTGISNGQSSSFTKLPAYKDGGSFTVRGRKGQDNNVVRFLASDGENVTITNPQQQMAERANDNGNGGSPTIIFNVESPDVDSFRLSRGQIYADLAAAMG